MMPLGRPMAARHAWESAHLVEMMCPVHAVGTCHGFSPKLNARPSGIWSPVFDPSSRSLLLHVQGLRAEPLDCRHKRAAKQCSEGVAVRPVRRRGVSARNPAPPYRCNFCHADDRICCVISVTKLGKPQGGATSLAIQFGDRH